MSIRYVLRQFNDFTYDLKINLSMFEPSAFPLGLEKWDGIFQSGKSQGILNRLEKSGKITQNTGKLKGFHNKIYLLFVSDI